LAEPTIAATTAIAAVATADLSFAVRNADTEPGWVAKLVVRAGAASAAAAVIATILSHTFGEADTATFDAS
jgi:hypothetical protein